MMAEVDRAGVPVPPQHTQQAMYDFRRAAHGPRGYKCSRKRKLDDYEEQVKEDEASEAMQTDATPEPQPLPKRQKTNNVVGVGHASGRPWKLPGEKASLKNNPLLRTTWEKKMKLKTEGQNFKALKQEAIAAHKEKLAKARKQKEEAKARKEANQKRSIVTQAITSNATLRKMMKSKKQRKLLQKADTLQQ